MSNNPAKEAAAVSWSFVFLNNQPVSYQLMVNRLQRQAELTKKLIPIPNISIAIVSKLACWCGKSGKDAQLNNFIPIHVWQVRERAWRRMTGSCRRCLGGERQRQAVIWAARIASLLMTPTVPFLPKARITIKSESHLLTWSPRYPAQGLFTHMHRRERPRSGSRGWKGGRLRAGHGTNRETEGMCSCSVAEWNCKILQ